MNSNDVNIKALKWQSVTPTSKFYPHSTYGYPIDISYSLDYFSQTFTHKCFHNFVHRNSVYKIHSLWDLI